MAEKHDYQEAIFWCNLLHPLIFGELDGESPHRYFQSLTQQEMALPDGSRGHVSVATLQRKWRLYQTGGIDALRRRPRQDRGAVRAVSDEILAKAIELKRQQPLRSDRPINLMLKSMYGKGIARSTLYRHLKNAGATKIRMGIDKTKVRKRWTRDYSGALWVGDFAHGPYVLVDGVARLTKLCVFIDTYSRYVVAARYYLRENIDVLVDLLIRAWTCHGLCDEIYVDNGKVFYARQLQTACYKLKVNLLHRPPREPQPGGVIERVIQTLQVGFESEVRAGQVLTLDDINRSLAAYLEIAYHNQVHSETGQKPDERYHAGLSARRDADTKTLREMFMQQEQRCVSPDFSDVRLFKRFYRVDPKLRGEKVSVRWDPLGDSHEVTIYSLRDEYLGIGKLYNRDYGVQVPDQRTSAPTPDYLQMLVREHEEQLRLQAQKLDYRTLPASSGKWSYSAFIQTLARLLGRKGGSAAFSDHEHAQLQKIHQLYPKLDEPWLLRAVEQAESKTIVHIAYQLQILHQENPDVHQPL